MPMGFPAWAGAAIAGGASLGGTIISAVANQKENKKARDWNESMYWKQEEREEQKWHQQNKYNEGIWNQQNEYNERVWHMMNQYNSPMAQMERFKEAGLNPNLIYGQMGNSPGIATAQFGRQSMGKGGLGNAVPVHHDLRFDPGITAYMQLRESSARTNNLEAQNQVLQQDAIGRSIDNINKGIKNATDNLNLENLKKYSADAAESAILKTKTEVDVMRSRDEREAALNAVSVQKGVTEIMKLRGEIVNQELDRQLKQLDMQIRGTKWQFSPYKIINDVLMQIDNGLYNVWPKKDPWDK